MNEPEGQVRDPNRNAIQKVGAAIVKDGKVLVVRKRDQDRPEYFMAGGRMEDGETQQQTLRRELDEELGVTVRSFEYLGEYEDLAVLEGEPIVIFAYVVEIDGDPEPRSEIKEYAWIGSDFESKGYEVGSIMARQVMPELRRLGKIP